MAVHYRPTDYLYISARLRAKETGLVGRERLARLCELADADAVLEALEADGVLRPAPGADAEQAMLSRLREELADVLSAVPDPTLFAFLQYPYDCHNVKSALKCYYRGVSPRELWLELGTVPTEAISALPGEVPQELPPHMREAVSAARTAFEQNGDPREIDFLLDAACFADMRDAAAPLPFAADLVATRADLTNLGICRRLLAMHAGQSAMTTMEHAFLPGGHVPLEALLAALSEGEEAFRALVSKGAYHAVFEADSAAEIERRMDDFYLEQARHAAAVPFGAEVPIGYLIGLEYAVKNLRILLAAKRAGADAATLKGRLRECYV